MLGRFRPADEVFEAAGHEGGGYDWEAVTQQLLRDRAPELEGRFGLDPEGSMFCAYSEDREALQALGARLAALFHDKKALEKLVATVDPDFWD